MGSKRSDSRREKVYTAMETSNVARVGSASFIIAAAFVFVLCAASLPKVDVFWLACETVLSSDPENCY
jgi:hypothetical protein